MKIFIDVDNIIVDFESQFRKFLNKKTRKKLAREDIRDFEFYKSFGISSEQEIKFHNEFLKKKGYKKLKIIKGCKEGIKRLMELGQIAFISPRPEEIRDITLEWFKKNKIPIRTDLLFLAKDKISYSSQFDIILEDKWEDALKLAQIGKNIVLYDYPWNRKKDNNGNILQSENIIRVSNWEEIIESIEKIAEEKYKKELTGDIFNIWKECVGVQMHFNQLIMRNRITFASVLFAAFGAALVFLRSGETILKVKGEPFYISDVIIAIAAIGLFSYFWIDTKYYFRLLLGAVEFTEKMDRDYKKLGLTCSITKSIKHEKALWVLIIHYLIICLALIAYVIARIWLK
jgi:uncharacterized HAD superfamily protein/uncharacterized membrane protein YqhA